MISAWAKIPWERSGRNCMKVYTKKRENFRINLIFVRISIGFSDKSWYADYQSKKYSSVITAGNEEE